MSVAESQQVTPRSGEEKETSPGFRLSEQVLHAIDRQVISSGLRLIILIPCVSIFVYFMAWAYQGASPQWWKDSIQPSVNLSFSTTNALLCLVLLTGYLFAIGFHRFRVRLSLQTFHSRVEHYKNQHRSVESLHGFDGLEFHLQKSMAGHTWTLLFAFLANILLLISIIFDLTAEYSNLSLFTSFSFTILSIGQHLTTRNSSFNMVEKTGLLMAYTPPVHPSTLQMVFNDLLRTHMDPLLRASYDEYIKEVESGFLIKVDRRYAREKFLITLYRHANGLDRKTMKEELEEVFTKEGLDYVLKNDAFSLEVWLALFQKVNQSCPAFFRMIDRLKQDLESGRESAFPDLIFEVDMENVVTTHANLFTMMHNLSDKPRTIVYRIQTPNFEPRDVAFKYRLSPGEKFWWSDNPLPLATEGDDDVLGIMSGLLKDGTVGWQTLLPKGKGDATVSIRLEEEDGELILGRQINVRVRTEFRQWLRQSSSIFTFVLGGIGVLSSIIMSLYYLFGQI
ncbi:MAG: hypothetical protein O3B67_02265 [archaeon]|nr:hypothetical protein [archaeon]